jgi:dihydroflavonol-4-reductase
MDVRDPQKDLVEPALKGTEGVLKASTSSRAKKVVLTSSMASVTDEPISGHVYTENDWNTLSSLSRNPYYYSKTVAERYAWKYVEDLPKDQKLDLVVMNPYFIIGPSHSKTQGINDSVKSIYQSMNGELPGIMDLCWGFVDVRDVAKAHILGMERQNASGRYLLVNPNG